MGDDPAAQLAGVIGIRKLLSIENRPPITEVIASPSLVPRLVEFLDNDNVPSLQVLCSFL